MAHNLKERYQKTAIQNVKPKRERNSFMNSKFYLETNAVRQLCPKLHKLRDNCYTSSHVLLELIAGISTDKEYRIRKQVNTLIKIDNDFGVRSNQLIVEKLNELKELKKSSEKETLIIVTKQRALTAVCEFLYQKLAIPLSASQKLDIRNSYNGSIDTFFDFWTWYSNKKLKEWTAGERMIGWISIIQSI